VAPSGDGAINLIHPVLIPATASALVLMMKRELGAKPAALWTAASAALAVALWQARPWSPASHLLTNLSIYLLSLLAAGAAVASILQFRRSPGAAVAHLGLALVVAGAALSGPYAYHMSYAAVLALDKGRASLCRFCPTARLT